MPNPTSPDPSPLPDDSDILEGLEKALDDDAHSDELARELRRLDELEKRVPPGAGSAAGRAQRNVPTQPEMSTPPKAPASEPQRSSSWKAGSSRAASILKGLAVAVGAMLVGWIGIELYDYATSEALKKMGPEDDLTAFIPTSAKVVWIDATFSRRSRDMSEPEFEPNVANEDFTIVPTQGAILALGIPLEGRPTVSASDCDINGMGVGNSDWFFQSFGGYYIGRSMSAAHPLRKGEKSVISVQYHMPGYELNRFVAQRTGVVRVYLVVQR